MSSTIRLTTVAKGTTIMEWTLKSGSSTCGALRPGSFDAGTSSKRTSVVRLEPDANSNESETASEALTEAQQ